MPRIEDYLKAAKKSLVLALVPYKRNICLQPIVHSAYPIQQATERAVYTSTLFPDGINKRLQSIHEMIGELRKNDERDVNINSMIRCSSSHTVENLIDIIIELEKVLLPIPGIPPVKRSLEAHILDAIDSLINAGLTLNPKASINDMIFCLGNEYDENGYPETAEQLYLIALQRDYRINEGDSSPFSCMVNDNISKETMAYFHLYQKKADQRPLARPFNTFVEEISQAKLLLDFGVARSFSTMEPAAKEESSEQRKRQKISDTRGKPQPKPSNNEVDDMAKFLVSFQ